MITCSGAQAKALTQSALLRAPSPPPPPQIQQRPLCTAARASAHLRCPSDVLEPPYAAGEGGGTG